MLGISESYTSFVCNSEKTYKETGWLCVIKVISLLTIEIFTIYICTLEI